MSIFDDKQLGVSIDQIYKGTIQQAKHILVTEKSRCVASFNNFWTNLTTKEKTQSLMDLLGTDATNLFIFHRAWQDFIKTCDPSYEVMSPPYELTFNKDGTVTVGEKK